MTEDIQYFAKQSTIYPRRVWGRYRKLKWVVMIGLLAIYYLAPWLRWDRGAHAPDQAILIDMPARRAYFFFIEIWPQEVYYLTGILILAAVALFFVTSMAGRVWCGYACPQTVWTDLFVWVERIVQGDRNARMRLDQAPLSLEKIWKKGLTHSIWFVIGLFTGGAWVFYFNDAPSLMQDILHADISWDVGGWILALTFSTYLMAGYAREQVCMYMCPYARFQSAMFDKDTLIIAYDDQRGEPRGKWKQKQEYAARSGDRASPEPAVAALHGEDSSPNREQTIKQGHCIDCDSCVVVCPMGIDIRNGLQMECIACGLCVDACNNVMEKIGLPKGLIRYDTEANVESRRAGNKNVSVHLLRPRTLYYIVIMAVVGGAMLYGLLNRSALELAVLHDRNPLFVQLSDGSIRNGYTINVSNKTAEDKHYHLTLEGLDDATMEVQAAGGVKLDALPVFADKGAHFRIFVTAPAQEKHRRKVTFVLRDNDGASSDSVETIFMSGEGE